MENESHFARLSSRVCNILFSGFGRRSEINSPLLHQPWLLGVCLDYVDAVQLNFQAPLVSWSGGLRVHMHECEAFLRICYNSLLKYSLALGGHHEKYFRYIGMADRSWPDESDVHPWSESHNRLGRQCQNTNHAWPLICSHADLRDHRHLLRRPVFSQHRERDSFPTFCLGVVAKFSGHHPLRNFALCHKRRERVNKKLAPCTLTRYRGFFFLIFKP